MQTTTTGKQAHTTGPWHNAGLAIYTNPAWKDGINSGGKFIAQVESQETFDAYDSAVARECDIAAESFDEAERTAALIAAAPELLAALEKLCSDAEQAAFHLSRFDRTRATALDERIKQALGAIAKAKGAQ